MTGVTITRNELDLEVLTLFRERWDTAMIAKHLNRTEGEIAAILARIRDARYGPGSKLNRDDW